jgi:hypothetical protein
MKKFANPEMEIEKFEICDVITTSSCDTHADDCPNHMGLV